MLRPCWITICRAGLMPVRLALTTGEAHDNRLVLTLLSGLKSGAMLLGDRGFDADWILANTPRYSAQAYP